MKDPVVTALTKLTTIVGSLTSNRKKNRLEDQGGYQDSWPVSRKGDQDA